MARRFGDGVRGTSDGLPADCRKARRALRTRSVGTRGGASHAVEAVGNQESLDLAVTVTRPGGTVSMLGVPQQREGRAAHQAALRQPVPARWQERACTSRSFSTTSRRDASIRRPCSTLSFRSIRSPTVTPPWTDVRQSKCSSRSPDGERKHSGNMAATAELLAAARD